MSKPDEYEQKYMEPGETVLHRDKVVWRLGVPLLGGFSLLSLGLGVATLVAAIVDGPLLVGAAGLVILAAGGVLGFCAATLTVLRTVVTAQAVHVQYGLWGPTIPLASIESAEIAKYDWTRFGGWGLRGGAAERAFTIQGSDARTLRVVWREGEQRRITWVSVDDADGTLASIQRARSRAAGAGLPRVRVAIDPESAPPLVEDAEDGAREDTAGSTPSRSKQRA